MSDKAPENKNSNNWLWILLAIIVAFILYLISKFRIQNANEKLTQYLVDKNEALHNIDSRIGYYKDEKEWIVIAKKQTTIFARCFLSFVLLIINSWYIWYCYPNSITIQHVFECIATLNASLLFLTSIFVFAILGSFFEIKTVWHSIQTLALKFLFEEKEQTIEALLRLDLENREALRKEIEETEQAIKANEELLNPLQDQTSESIPISIQETN